MAGDPTPQNVREDLPDLDPKAVAGMVADASDAQLGEGFATNRELILGEVFRRMVGQLRSEGAAGLEAVVEWRILGRTGGGHDRWQVVISNGACTVNRDGEASPRVTFTLAPVDFMRLVTGNASGPRLFLVGRLKIEGDLVFAARVPGLFTIPGS